MMSAELKSMDNLKLAIIRKVQMLDSKLEVQTVLASITDALSREYDKEDKYEQEFTKWKVNQNKMVVE